MPTYSYTINPPGPIDSEGPVAGYVVNADPLSYADTVSPPSGPFATNATSNYRLAFSTAPPTPHPRIGQIWPRGAGQA